jgi:DNA repair exonuclease SbcCD ATPase subunit
MSDASSAAKSLRERLGASTEERLGRALSDLLENPLLTGAIGRAFDAREKATQAQEVAMGVLNLPSAADIERLTRRLRSVSNRLEGIEDGVDRLDRAMSPPRDSGAELEIDQRLSAIETQLARLTDKLDRAAGAQGASTAASAKAPAAKAKAQRAKSTAKAKAPSAKTKPAGAKAKRAGAKAKPAAAKARAAAKPGKA